MIHKHPENDPSNDAEKVDDSVSSTVGEGVADHRDAMMAGRSEIGCRNAVEDLGQQSRCVAETLPEPCPAPSDALVDDGLGIMAASVRGRSSKAGKASQNDDVEDGKTISKTSNRGLKNRANPYPPPGTIFQNDVENAGKSSKRRFPQRSCYASLLHNPGPQSSVTSRKYGRKGRGDCSAGR